jgi:hypothetical protein
MNLNNQILISSITKSINDAKKGAIMDNTDIILFNILSEYDIYTRSIFQYQYHNLFIKDLISTLKYSNPKICNYKAVLDTYINSEASAPSSPVPTLSNFSVNTNKQKIFPNADILYDAYTFNINDILNSYSDNDDNLFYQLIIDRTDLDGGSLKIWYGPDVDNYMLYGENSSTIKILASDISNITYYSSLDNVSSHTLSIKVVDKFNNVLTVSSYATLTINRPAAAGNQPPTIGDIAIYPLNRAVTTITLAMLTTSLTPPYNDPEGDLIDAIRINEVSTANEGVFKLNNVPITAGQIITREDLISGLFTHEGPNVNSITTDAFEFSARDEGSQIWVN